jgi:drug/metabolite transporter (DMT)-like permease
MTKILIILFVGLIFEGVGVVLLKDGINLVCQGRDVTMSNMLPLVLKGVVQPKILLGVFFEAIFFGCLLYLMSQKDISFVWPLTSLSFVVTTGMAVIYLKEPVTLARWVGTALIMIGAAIITWNEKQNERQKPPPTSMTAAAASATAPDAPQNQ